MLYQSFLKTWRKLNSSPYSSKKLHWTDMTQNQICLKTFGTYIQPPPPPLAHQHLTSAVSVGQFGSCNMQTDRI
jgi:hypothetical protein